MLLSAMKQWDKAFKKQGKIFVSVQENIPDIAREFKKNEVKRILDLGSGSGRHIVYLSKQGFDVYGFDISESGIKISKDWLKKEGANAKFKTGSIYKKLPYQDNFFDAVISTNTIHHGKIENIRKAISEIKRILKPEGLIFITVRKRKLRKSYPKFTIINKSRKQKADYQIIAPRTYVPINGTEKGLLHYLFNKRLMRKEFKNFKINNIWADSNKRYYCFIDKLKNGKSNT